MRPTTRRALLALAGGLVVMGAVVAGVPRIAPLGHVAARISAQIAANVVDLAASQARAEEMKFEPLPPESSTSLERSSSRRDKRTTSSSAPVPPEPSTPTTAPEAPTTPVVIGKTGDVMRVGSDIDVGKDEVVTGDVLAVGGDIRVEGHVEGNAVSMGGDIYLQPTAKVDGDVVCMGGELHEEPGAAVGGKRVVGLGGNRRASRVRHLRDLDIDLDHPRSDHGIGVSFAWLLCWLFVAWLIAKIAPGRTAAAVELFRSRPGTSFLTGWLAIVLTIPGLIAVVVVFALLCVTLIGIPLAIAVLFGYFIFLALFVVWGGVVGAALVGERVALRQGVVAPTILRAAVMGVLVLDGALLVSHLIEALPFFGWFGRLAHVILIIVNSLIGVTGWGALLYSEFTTGMIARWWHGRRGGSGGGPTPAPAGIGAPPPVVDPTSTSGGTSVTTVTVPQGPVAPQSFAPPPPPPPAPPAPPSSFMPPGEGGPPGEATPPGPTPGS